MAGIDETMILLKQMMVLFILMLLGFYLAKKGILDSAGSSKISWIVVNVANPALIVSGSLGENTIQPQELAQIMVFAFGLYLFLLLLSSVVPMLFGIAPRDRNIYRVMMVFGNIGFMGFPIMSSMYGNETLLYGAMFLIPYNLFMYTYGVNAMGAGSLGKDVLETNDSQGDDSACGERGGGGKKAGETLRSIFNLGVIACIIALLIYILKLPVPYVISQVITMLSNLTAPLSMMVIGASMAGISFRELVSDGRLVLFSLFRQIVLPVFGFLILKQFITDPLMLGVCLIILSVPAGSMVAMLAQQYHGNTQAASKGVILTTVLSVVTMPLVFMLTGM